MEDAGTRVHPFTAPPKPTPWDLCHRCSNPHLFFKMVRLDDGIDQYDAYICKACAESPETRLDRLEMNQRILAIVVAVIVAALLISRFH